MVSGGRGMSKKLIAFLVISFAVVSLIPAHAFVCRAGAMGFVPQPRILFPDADNVDLSGKKSLEFAWSPHEGDRFMRRYYDFRLYKGYEMVESGLMMKKRVPAGTCGFEVDAGLFDNGGTYTWSLRQIYRSGGKSYRSYKSFKVTK
jgi:hypothetical protein